MKHTYYRYQNNRRLLAYQRHVEEFMDSVDNDHGHFDSLHFQLFGVDLNWYPKERQRAAREGFTRWASMASLYGLPILPVR